MRRSALRAVGLAALLAVAWAGASPAASPAAEAAAQAASADLDELMHLLAARRHGQVDFVEQHFLKVLKRPVESYGVMIYDAPQRLEKRTIEPRPESLVLDGTELTIQRKGRTHVLELAAYPSMLPFVESLRATLAGDLPALEREFNVGFGGTLEHWTLTLAPRDSKVASTVSQVRIDGSRDALLKVDILEANGDRSLMTLRDRPAP
jgi:outer membrane lipoprotein-sorting protein